MAIGTLNPTLLDVAQRVKGDGHLDKIVEMMTIPFYTLRNA